MYILEISPFDLKPGHRQSGYRILLGYTVRFSDISPLTEETAMDSLNATNARKNLYKLIEETAANHQPVKSSVNRLMPFWSPKRTGKVSTRPCIF